MTEKLCHCGQPLHYRNLNLQKMVEDMIAEKGETTRVTNSETKKTYLVPRHYIALHGIKGNLMDTYGFEEVKNGN